MTIVIRTTLLLLAVVTMVTFTSDADGQIFRRLRENIRSNYSSQRQVAPVQVAPQQLRPGQQPQRQYGQSLTPYSRLTPAQRNGLETAQQRPNVNPGNQNANPGQVNVRVVTYFDPRTGRTYERRFLVPASNAATAQAGRQNNARGNAPTTAQGLPKGRTFDKIPKPIAANPPQQPIQRPSVSVVQQQPKLVIPSITAEPVPTQIQQATTPPPQQLPTLAGPANTGTPESQPLTQQVEPRLGITIADASLDDDGDIQIDTAVTPATATSNDISIDSPVSEGVPPTSFSVLEAVEDSAEPEPLDLDLDIDIDDEVEAFFGQ